MTNNELLYQTFADFRQDFEELKYLISSNITQLAKFKKRMESIKPVLRPETLEYVESYLHFHLRQLFLFQKRIQRNRLLINKTPTFSLYERLIEEKDNLYDLLRTQQGILASIVVCLDWQSPSFAHTKYSQAGVQTGKITGNINDYKRDVHLDAKGYEKLYKKEYLEARFKFNIYTYLVNSGMAAFTTILNFLLGEKKMSGTILVGKSSYFQYKLLLQKTSIIRIIEVDEKKTNEIIDATDTYKPSVIFLDSLCNSPDIAAADLPKIISHLVSKSKNEVYLVIDTTCTPLGCQPWNLGFGKTKKVHFITFESLNKYHQFGLDRVTAGVINVMGGDLGKMYYYREDCGTIITDASVYALPLPDRKRLTKRLERLERNAGLLASFLPQAIYPGRGSFLTLQFHKKYRKTRFYKKFVQSIISESKKRKIESIAGTSFGLNKTRFYHVIPRVKGMEPFIRIAAGTEDRFTIEGIVKVMEKVLKEL